MDVAVFKVVVYQDAVMEQPFSLSVGDLRPSP